VCGRRKDLGSKEGDKIGNNFEEGAHICKRGRAGLRERVIKEEWVGGKKTTN